MFRKHILLLGILLCCLDLHAQIKAVEVDKGSSSNQVTDIIVVFKMHFDIGYTDWSEGVLQKYTGSMLDKTLESIQVTSRLPKEEQFKWTIPGWPLKYMLENCPADKKEELENAVRNERIIPHALPMTIETEAGDVENLVRGMEITNKLNKAYGLPYARDAKLTDVPSHSRILPTVLKKAGVDILHIGCNPGSSSPDVPPLFWWEGPDGSRLLTFYWAEYYGSGILPPENWPHKTWLAMIHTHENSGAPTPEEVAALLKEAKEKMPQANVRIGRLSDFYDLLMKENPDLPVITGDMPDTWIHGYMSMPREMKISKELQRKTANTEIMNTQMNQWGLPARPIEDKIDRAYENMLLFDEHTFGIAMTHGNQQQWKLGDEFKIEKSLGHYDFMEQSWIEKGNRIQTAQRIIKPIWKRQLLEIADAVNTEGKKILVYNALPWTRSGRVELFAGVYQKQFHIYGLKDVQTGEVIPVYEDYNLLSFDAKDVPSMGYKTYVPILQPIEHEKKIRLDKEAQTIENPYFRLTFDEHKGTVVSLWDKKQKKELIDKNSEYDFGEYFVEMPGQKVLDEYNDRYIKPKAQGWARDEMIRATVPHPDTRIHKGICEKIMYQDLDNAVRVCVLSRLDNEESQKYIVTYTLYADQPYVEINWGVNGKKANPLPEAGWLSFPFKMKNPQYRLNRIGDIVNPETEIVKKTNTDFLFLNTSMTLSEKNGNGVCINTPNAPGISLDRPGLFRYTGNHDFKTGQVFVNLYNNQWGTNFTEWVEGSFSSKIYVWNYKQYDLESSFITPSEETRTALEAVFTDSPAGKLPACQSGISLDRKGILITSYKATEEGTVLRLWEEAGKTSSCKVSLTEHHGFKRAYPCDLRQRILDPEGIEIKGNSFSFPIKAHEPVNFILK